MIHPQSGKLSVVRIFDGTLTGDATLVDTTRDLKVRAAGLFRLQGKKQEPVATARPGEIVAIARLEGVQTGDTLATSDAAGVRDVPKVAEPLFAVAIRPKERLDEAKLSQMLARIVRGGPVARRRARRIHERTAVARRGRGARRDVDAAPEPQVSPRPRDARRRRSPIARRSPHRPSSTRATSTRPAATASSPTSSCASSRASAATASRFREQIVGGVVPRTVLSGGRKRACAKRCCTGPIAEFPVVDLHVTLIDGPYHDVDSSEASFKTAASMAMRDALPKCGPVLARAARSTSKRSFPTKAPRRSSGRITSKRGQVLSFEPTEPRGFQTHRRRRAAEPNSTNYITELRTATQGLGTYSWRHDRFEPAPPQGRTNDAGSGRGALKPRLCEHSHGAVVACSPAARRSEARTRRRGRRRTAFVDAAGRAAHRDASRRRIR